MTRSRFAHAVTLLVLLASTANAAEFHMIHPTRGSASIGAFTPEGPQLGTMRMAPNRLDYIAFDAGTGTYFGQQVSTLGVIEKGVLTPVELPESVDLSHSGGLAFDAERGSVLVASRSGAGTVLFEYTPATRAWNEIGNVGRDDFRGLACDGAQGTIYVLDKPHHTRGCTNVRVFNRTGAQVAAIDLSAPIPFYDELRPRVQLVFEDGSLYAMVTNQEEHPRVSDAIFAIDPASGAVTRTPYKATADLTSQTWPGWDGGPPPSAPMTAAGASGAGHYSCYRTPEPLVRKQASELHVVAIEAGNTNYLEWLKKVKSLSASSGEGGGVSIEVELDPDAEINHPVVEVFVEKTGKPVTLVLVTAQPVVWSIETAPGATIDRVVTHGAPFFSTSTVIGVDENIVVDGGTATAAVAWELDQSSSASRFDEMIVTIRKANGLRENSYQGLGRATALRVPYTEATGGTARHAVVDEQND